MANKSSNLLWGLLFIVLGVLFGGNALDLWNFNLFFEGWWTLFIIVPSIMGLFQRGSKISALIGLVVGVMLLLSAQNIISWYILSKLIIPIIFIFIGLQIIFRKDFSKDKFYEKSFSSDGLPEYTAFFSGNDINFPYEKFVGANLTAIFGGVDLNLKNAIIDEDVVINSLVIFGGADIIVPPNVKVKVSSIPILGGNSNKTSQVIREDVPTIYIKAISIFGGTEIK
ncbi:LiaF transmembrane domain-containing protein [Clostridium cylindrosporum]|uniref:LiaF transmembrane domain-containing protein n=1 Tax=Clostridium cylindrosporum DSM 605 TaxID=1121307 RepID=A0A0J8DDA8_CLOCY|nr:membrane protein [Clostridium cylindrosporum]KMT22223.1 hypothetical protein CLCY_4c01960 [Clostridium cylindrosporum DSM 605]